MIDRTDLQLMLCEQIMEMDTYDLMDLVSKLTGEDLEMFDEEEDQVTGTIETLAIDDPAGLKKWLGFTLYTLGERIEIPT